LQPSIFNLPAPTGKNKIVYRSGYNSNIITVLNSQFSAAVKQCEKTHFSGANIKDKARAIYNYLRTNITYKKDPAGKQLIQLPARMIRGTQKGDCKSLALSAAAFLYCNGAKNVFLRYASYHPTDHTPTHVYTVATDEKGQQIIVDPVYKQFNREAPYTYKKDYKMQIAVLSGTPVLSKFKPGSLETLQRIRTKVRPGGFYFNAVTNEMMRKAGKNSNMNYNAGQLKRYAARVKAAAAATPDNNIRAILNQEAAALDRGNFNGVIYSPRSGQAIRGIEEEIGKLSLKKVGKKLKKIKLKNIVKGVKAVSFVAPRKAFLAMVRLNVRGIATRLGTLSPADLKKVWVDKFAGKLSVLESTINKGKKKKPLFGAGKKVRAIKGIGVIIDESNTATIGAEPVSTAAIIAAAAPIAVAFISILKKRGVKEVPEQGAAPQESGNFPEAESANQEAEPKIKTWLNKALDIAKETGIIPDRPETPAEGKVSQAIPGDDLETEPATGTAGGSGFKISPAILIGGAAVAALVFMRKK